MCVRVYVLHALVCALMCVRAREYVCIHVRKCVCESQNAMNFRGKSSKKFSPSDIEKALRHVPVNVAVRGGEAWADVVRSEAHLFECRNFFIWCMLIAHSNCFNQPVIAQNTWGGVKLRLNCMLNCMKLFLHATRSFQQLSM